MQSSHCLAKPPDASSAELTSPSYQGRSHQEPFRVTEGMSQPDSLCLELLAWKPATSLFTCDPASFSVILLLCSHSCGSLLACFHDYALGNASKILMSSLYHNSALLGMSHVPTSMGTGSWSMRQSGTRSGVGLSETNHSLPSLHQGCHSLPYILFYKVYFLTKGLKWIWFGKCWFFEVIGHCISEITCRW